VESKAGDEPVFRMYHNRDLYRRNMNDDRISRDIASSAPFTSDLVTLASIDHTPTPQRYPYSTDLPAKFTEHLRDFCNLYRQAKDSVICIPSLAYLPSGFTFWELF
jgi:hypothetical protein